MGFRLLFILICHASGSYVRPLPRSTLSVPLDTKSSTDPQQVHISLSGSNHMRISWMTKDEHVSSIVEYGTRSGIYTSSAKGEDINYCYLTYKSANIHHVVIGPLEANTIYYYRCGGNGREYSFKTPPVQLPIVFAVVGDLGQTEWTNSTLQHVQRMNYDVLLLPGDLSYADDWKPRWDSFGRLVEPLASARPWMVTQGNHEIEKIPMLVSTPFKAYNARWKMPYQESGSASNLYYSFEVAGAHILMLGSYTDFGPDSVQYKWLQGDLSRVNRRRTPCLIALIHAPWYNTYTAHQGEGDDMKEAMEQLLHDEKVDIIFTGHVHAYERFVDGTLIAPTNPRSWDAANLMQWILITKVRDITVTGNGLIEAQGDQWWQPNEESYGSSLPGDQPTSLRFYGSYNVTVQGITITNSPGCHLKFDSCTSVSVANVTISSPANSPNTDGIHLQNSQHVEIQHSSIGSGDDCVSIQTGCSGIRVHNINCGPGHGISIGALGVDGTKSCVSNVTVYDSTVHDSLNGIRIKTWQGGMGSVRGVSFSNIQVSNVKIPINIDQYYCESRTCKNRTSAVAISDVTYEKIRGTYIDTALHLACSDNVPCTDLKLIDIELRPVYVSARPFCWNSYGQSQAPLQPDTTVACLRTGKPLHNPGHANSNTDAC